VDTVTFPLFFSILNYSVIGAIRASSCTVCTFPAFVFEMFIIVLDRLCGLMATDPEVRFPALPDFLRSSGSGAGCTQPREDN
jgi:hypothetical protein